MFIFNFSDNAILSDCESSIIDRGPGSNCDTNNMDIWWYWRQYIISPSCDPPWSCLTFSLFQSFRSLLHASLSLLFFVQSQHQRLSPCIDCVIYVAVGLVAESSKYAKSRQNAIHMLCSVKCMLSYFFLAEISVLEDICPPPQKKISKARNMIKEEDFFSIQKWFWICFIWDLS